MYNETLLHLKLQYIVPFNMYVPILSIYTLYQHS